MKVLVACEYSGRVRDAFTAKGHDAMSCDLLPTDAPGKHYQGDIRDVLDDSWDVLIAHPPCTYLSVSGMHWTTRGLRDLKLTEDALDFVNLLMNAPIKRIAIENPVSIISSRIRKPDQIIQPWQFGEDASKKTCLWLKGLPKLESDLLKVVPPRGWSVGRGGDSTHKEVSGVMFSTQIKPPPKMLWANQTDSGQNKLGPSDDRWKIRSLTYLGIAQAFADQWGS